MKKRAILFDLDDTLYDLGWPFIKACQDFLPEIDLDLEEVFKRTRYYSDEVFDLAQAGEMSLEDMYCYRYQNAFKDFGIELTREGALKLQELYKYYQDQIALSPEISEILKELKKSWIIGIVSNGLKDHQRSKIKTLKLDQIVSPENIFISEEVGFSKPKKEFFDYVLKGLNLKPEECYYIGDTFETDIIGSSNAGLTPVWYNHRKYDKGVNKTALTVVKNEKELLEFLTELQKDQKIS